MSDYEEVDPDSAVEQDYIDRMMNGGGTSLPTDGEPF